MKFSYVFFLCFFVSIYGFGDVSEEKARVLYFSLDPLSLSKQYAYYKLFPNTDLGKKALENVWHLLGVSDKEKQDLFLPETDLKALINIINASPGNAISLNDSDIDLIERLSNNLKNKQLKGSKVFTIEEVLALDNEDIDVARALLVYEYDEHPNKIFEIKRNEAALNLMALQIHAKLPKNPSDRQIVACITEFIFHEMQFRFPPHSLHIKDIDLYTFLPSVIDSRKGVCLGVSTLYLAIAQRLGLTLEIITPPGHIYVRHREGEDVLNIETTARGIHIPTEMYLGINTKSLSPRTIREVIGMAFFNQASVFWQRGNNEKAIEAYEKAYPYLEDDPSLKLFLGINYVIAGKKKQGYGLLRQIENEPFDGQVYKDTLAEDILHNKVSVEALKAAFMSTDETKVSIEKKQQALKKALRRSPKFRGGLFQLATTYLQLGRYHEGIEYLTKCYQLDPIDPKVNYYLSALYTQRFQYKKAWEHFKDLESFLKAHDHAPKPYKQIHLELRQLYPF